MIYISNKDSSEINLDVDMILTDPPFEMSGAEILRVISGIKYDHLVLICSLHQALDFYKLSNLEFAFDLIIDHKVPRKSFSYCAPNFVHSNIVYFRKKGIKSAFDRRLVQRHDQYSDDSNAYYPSIFTAPKVGMKYKYQKNQLMINDLVGSFEVQSICDPFSGSGTTGLACVEHKKDAYLIEINNDAFTILENNLSLFADVNYF